MGQHVSAILNASVGGTCKNLRQAADDDYYFIFRSLSNSFLRAL
jgi:hypothetical protein